MPHKKANGLGLSALALSVLAALVVIVSTSSAQNPPAAAAPQTVTAGKTTEQTYKNIQALKGLPDTQLMPMMNYISASLGVRCTFCHVNKEGNWDFASDEKASKITARKMITMTVGINKNTFDGNTEVSCYTCHRGRTSVVHTLSMPLPTPEPRPSPSPAATANQPQQREALPTAEQILEKYYQALGGTAAIEKLKSRVMKGTLTTASGVEVGYELTEAEPDKVLAVFNTPQGGVLEKGFNGDIGWEKSGQGVRDLGKTELFYFRRYPGFYQDLKLTGQFTRMTVGKQKINDRDMYMLRATTTSGQREQLYFDVQTGLLMRRVTTTNTPIGNIPEQIDFEDYRDVDGLKLPFTIRVSAIDPNYSVVRKFTEIKLNVPIDLKRFNKPA